MNTPILLDITQLAAEPHRSGIQRVQREVLRHWPDPARLVLVAMDPGGVIRQLPNAVRDVLCPPPEIGLSTFDEDRRAIAALTATAPVIPEGLSRHILNLELFYDSWRADFYRRLCGEGWKVQWLIYDFMPWLHPELFPQGTSRACMHYLYALQHVPDVAFISQQTRTEYAKRVMRRKDCSGPVLPLGADGLGLEPQVWSASRRDIVMVGTLERRKNVHLVMEAFRSRWDQGHDARLVMAGRVDPQLRPHLDAFLLDGAPQVSLLEHPTDQRLRQALRGARAVLSASSVEGFGLTTYEALHCGIPTISAASIPSMQGLPPLGQIRLEVVTAAGIAEAVGQMEQDAVAETLWAEAHNLRLPGWLDFVHELARWAA